ncbi:hypothetical protein SDJN03_29353, partial [Cucurbita argyrosperma subsp. sororia]
MFKTHSGRCNSARLQYCPSSPANGAVAAAEKSRKQLPMATSTSHALQLCLEKLTVVSITNWSTDAIKTALLLGLSTVEIGGSAYSGKRGTLSPFSGPWITPQSLAPLNSCWVHFNADPSCPDEVWKNMDTTVFAKPGLLAEVYIEGFVLLTEITL